MRTKEIIFDEFVRAKEIYESGFENKYNPTQRELTLLAQHIKLITGYGEVRLCRAFAEKLKELCPDWNQIIYRDKIKSAISWAMDKDLTRFKPVPITQKEIDAIFTAFPLDTEIDYQKIAFVMLVLAKGLASREFNSKRKKYKKSKQQDGQEIEKKKYDNPIYFISHEYNFNIKEIAKVKISTSKVPYYMFDLREKGLIDPMIIRPKNPRQSVSFPYAILFADKKDATPVIVVENFEDILSYFPKQPEKLKCEKCGREIKKAKKNGKLICTWCYNKLRREDVKLNVRKLRASKKSN